MPITSLPEELLLQILKYVFHVPMDRLYLASDGPWALHGPHPSPLNQDAPLRVSKTWRRVGTPLLYRFLTLQDKDHHSSVAEVLRDSPAVADAVQCLTLRPGRGGYGRTLTPIARLTPKTKILSLDLSIRSDTSITGIKQALHLWNPAHLLLSCRKSTKRLNQRWPELLAKLTELISRGEHWSRLVSVLIESI